MTDSDGADSRSSRAGVGAFGLGIAQGVPCRRRPGSYDGVVCGGCAGSGQRGILLRAGALGVCLGSDVGGDGAGRCAARRDGGRA